MDRSIRSLGADSEHGDVAVLDAEGSSGGPGAGDRTMEPSPMSKATRSLSDGGGTPGSKLSPSPLILEAGRRTSKDDSAIRNPPATPLPVTPSRSEFPRKPSGLSSLHLPYPDRGSGGGESPHVKPAPLSPKLDHSHIYASPTSALPRRSRGLDFSRAATSLHHSTLADQSSPDSSPTIGGRGAMNIPGASGGGSKRYGGGGSGGGGGGGGDFGAAETSNSLWSMMGNHEKMHISSSLGSATNLLGSDSSSSSDDDDLMDEDMEEPYITTPQIPKTTPVPGLLGGVPPWAPGGSPAANSLLSFQQRQRPRKQHKKRLRGPIGLGFSSILGGGGSSGASGSGNGGLAASKSPPNSLGREPAGPHSRRESISWAANQLNLSGNESDDGTRPQIMDSVEGVLGAPGRDGQTEVIRRVVTRRGNLLPKTKAFARMRAALAEESTPVDSEVRREAEVVRQVRESDLPVEHHRPPPLSVATTALSSPNMGDAHDVDELVDDAMMVDGSGGGGGGGGAAGSSSSSFKHQALRNSRGNRIFWDTFSESSSIAGGGATTPPPPSSLHPRGSSSAMSVSNDDSMSMDSPSTSSGTTSTMLPTGGIFPMSLGGTRSSSGAETPQQVSGAVAPGQHSSHHHHHHHHHNHNQNQQAGGATVPPTAAEITRRINSKRRRDDDFDPVSFKRRAVSPGVSVHNSPVTQSPLQRDLPWGSRPGSNGHDRPSGGGGSGAPSEAGSQGGAGASQQQQQSQGQSQSQSQGGRVNGKGRVGYQGMVDTNDGITKLSID